MAIKNFVSNDFLSTFVDSINVFDCRLPGVSIFVEKLAVFWHNRMNIYQLKYTMSHVLFVCNYYTCI